MTYRERREARAEKLREWAGKREEKATAARESTDAIAGMIPMGQPILVGHHSEKRHRRDIARIDNGMRSQIEHGRKADSMRSRADEIDRQADNAIYSDDPDAIERLEEKLAGMEAQRTAIKERNAAFRKEHRAELKELSAYERDQAMPHRGYELTNLSGNISRTRKRLAQLKANGGKPPVRTIAARRDGDCPRCQARIQTGDSISRVDGEWGHTNCPGEE